MIKEVDVKIWGLYKHQGKNKTLKQNLETFLNFRNSLWPKVTNHYLGFVES